MTVSGFESPISPEAGDSLLLDRATPTPEPEPAAEPAAEPVPETPAPVVTEKSVAEELADLERMVSDVLGREAPKPAAETARAETPDPTKDEIEQMLEQFEDGSPERMVLEKMLKRQQALEAAEAQRQADAAEAQAEADVQAYLEQVKSFAEKFPGVKPDQVEAIAAQHAEMVNQNEAMAELAFEEVARRMFGDALDAMRKPAPSPEPVKNGAPAAGGTDKGHPKDLGIGGGAPGKAEPFEPGPGRGFKDITDHLVQTGALRAVIQRS